MNTRALILFGGAVGLIAWGLRRNSEQVAQAVEQASEVASIIMEPIKNMISGPRGIRNNNPGNVVRTGTKWRGMSADQSADSRFIVFDAPEWGLRAIARILRGYHANGLTTIQQMINRWAPPVENNTGAYINAVAARIGVTPTTPLTLTNEVMAQLMQAIVQHENGMQPYTPEQFAQAIALERSA